MKFIYKYFVFLFFISFSAGAQPPAETVPDFNFYKLDKTTFTNKSVESDKLLFLFSLIQTAIIASGQCWILTNTTTDLRERLFI